ncbi:hypothetical protein CDAR_42952 [Caerostris darwini]|uniref:non-specific serine/threonine protein kinase n=1 Tax=Caerostris darwini TaxID=1538125 RepID=A0AAV4WJV6_9ARAC|nr:hypothetical protein CDAR_42952 [Caerostris darwini]
MDSYQFIKQIRQSNYGDIWLMKCSKTRKKFIMKRFDLHHSSKREQRAAYLEAKLLSTLKHPNIVTYLDSFYNSKGNLFIVMNYCECGDFHSFIKERNGVYFEEKEIINWFVQICMALKYLHDKGILHRDLKTQNIFLTKNKLVKVGDLGIAQVLKAAEVMATTFTSTPYYMNPEVLSGKPYNQKTDVWALGCCMYEIATLEYIFAAQNMQKLVKGKIPSIPRKYSVGLFNIISSMLDPDPDKRPSVTELLLNDFIRKFIILFLQEPPIKLNSSKWNSSRSTPSLTDKHKPLLKLSSMEVTSSKIKTCQTTENTSSDIIKTVPDSNGNGDGNDNSQYHAIFPILLHPNKNFEDNSCQINSKTKTPFVSMPSKNAPVNFCQTFKESTNSSEITSLSPSVSSRSTPSINPQKLRGENSFNILNNLSYTIRQSRLQNWQGIRNGFFPMMSKAKYFCGIDPPKSAEELYVNYAREKLPERCSLSAQHSSKMELHEKTEIPDHLPQITTDKVEKHILTMHRNKITLPVIENEISDVISNDVGNLTWESGSIDDRFDKLLIQNILDCNDKQAEFSKSSMYHHRKEILKLNEISNSTSIA